MIEATKSNPAPLDGFESAKPNEPIFTLQGGDPLAAPLVVLWAQLARVRADITQGDADWIYPLFLAANRESVSHDPKEIENLLVRASAAEQVAWSMDEYRKGVSQETSSDQSLDELDRLDIYDLRRRYASLISNFFSEMSEYRERLVALEFIEVGGQLWNAIEGEILSLRTIHKMIEPRRGNL